MLLLGAPALARELQMQGNACLQEGAVILADEISPDSCRLWDIETKEKMDKDRFRRDLGGLVEAYSEVARRLGIINENEPLRGTGPVLVK